MKFQFKLTSTFGPRGASDDARDITQKLNRQAQDQDFESEEKAREWAEAIIKRSIYMVFDRWHFDKLEVAAL